MNKNEYGLIAELLSENALRDSERHWLSTVRARHALDDRGLPAGALATLQRIAARSRRGRNGGPTNEHD